jgi:hypothetical protein
MSLVHLSMWYWTGTHGKGRQSHEIDDQITDAFPIRWTKTLPKEKKALKEAT